MTVAGVLTLKDCRDYVLDALRAEQLKRKSSDDWIANERTALAVAANEWAEAHGVGRRITVEDVERIESNAMGHVDYSQKIALYVAEFIMDPAPWMEA